MSFQSTLHNNQFLSKRTKQAKETASKQMHLDCYAVFVQNCKKSSLELIIFEINRKLADGISWRSQYIRELPMGYGKSLIF